MTCRERDVDTRTDIYTNTYVYKEIHSQTDTSMYKAPSPYARTDNKYVSHIFGQKR